MKQEELRSTCLKTEQRNKTRAKLKKSKARRLQLIAET